MVVSCANAAVAGLVSSFVLPKTPTSCSGSRTSEFLDASWKRASLSITHTEPSKTGYCVVRMQTVEEAKVGTRTLLISSVIASEVKEVPSPRTRPLRVLVAGGGIGGLVFALAAKNKGLDVVVFERDMSAIRGEGQYRGPIQIQSNALAALEAVDRQAAEEIMANGCVTGDRINGLVDGISGEWYCKFDTFTPAVERGLPITRVISRMKLQEILSGALGLEHILNGSNVVDFVDDGRKVKVTLEDGRTFEGDPLQAARIADFVPADIDTVGYRVFLGHKQYFVSSDVGQGKMQWYAFHNEPAGGVDAPGARKARLMSLFGGWCDKVVDLLMATPEEQILRRDIYDRAPILTWSKGRVTLLGDSAHAMQPNLGQGGCMAIEDGFQLALDLSKAAQQPSPDLQKVLKDYEGKRRIRVGVIHGLARMAAFMASTYKLYLGEGLGPLSFIQKLKIPHPGRAGGRFLISLGMQTMLSWILGGNSFALEGRVPYCSLKDKADSNLTKWFRNDDELEKATNADWYLVPASERMPIEGNVAETGRSLLHLCKEESKPTIVGYKPCEPELGEFRAMTLPHVAPRHAKLIFNDGALFITDLDSKTGTWINSIKGGRHRLPPKRPVRVHPEDVIEFGPAKEARFKVKLRRLHSLQRSVFTAITLEMKETVGYVNPLPLCTLLEYDRAARESDALCELRPECDRSPFHFDILLTAVSLWMIFIHPLIHPRWIV
uniref:Zeaxanthin epoxidase, chloroplastic n=1 Tax=Physcomitrium patens TaxID=3218 RepID=A0A2K1KNC1_PHYPA|nr:hypothetical protein PHYPA_006176 [Physcomitrium patens]